MSYDTHFHSFLPGVIDNGTDKIIVYTATNNNVEEPLLSAFNMYNEYTNISVNNEYPEGQLMSVLNYRTRPLAYSTLLFLTLTWLSVFIGFGLMGYTVYTSTPKEKNLR